MKGADSRNGFVGKIPRSLRGNTVILANNVNDMQRHDECTVRQLASVQIALLSILGRVITIIVIVIVAGHLSLYRFIKLVAATAASRWRLTQATAVAIDSSSIVSCAFSSIPPFLPSHYFSNSIFSLGLLFVEKHLLGRCTKEVNGR